MCRVTERIRRTKTVSQNPKLRTQNRSVRGRRTR